MYDSTTANNIIAVFCRASFAKIKRENEDDEEVKMIKNDNSAYNYDNKKHYDKNINCPKYM